MPPLGFYFALFRGDVVDNCAPRREAYYLDERRGLGYLNAVPDLIPLLEMFCAGDHGTVVGFAEQNGRVVPVLREASNQGAIDWGLPLVRQTIAQFVDHLVLNVELVNQRADVRDAATAVLREFWTKPTLGEARAWVSFPWEDGLGIKTSTKPLARVYSWQDVVRAYRLGRVFHHHRASWLAGSLVLSPSGVRAALNTLARARWRLWMVRGWLDRRSEESGGVCRE